MVDIKQFKEWLGGHTNYTDDVISDTASRIKRADGILCWYDEEVYQFHLEHEAKYKELSGSVRSQIKKAVKLYREFVESRK